MLDRAIVIGGSIAGKLAAKALATSFRQVIILEAGSVWKKKHREKGCLKHITHMFY